MDLASTSAEAKPVQAAEPAAKRLPAMQRSVGAGRVAVKTDGAGRTRLAGLYQKANAKIRLPRQHGDVLDAVLINTAGGLTGGDRLTWTVEAAEDTQARVTTQACERIYRSSGGTARQTTHITVADGARLEWLPQETILFDRSALDRRMEVVLEGLAAFVGIETIMLGRAAMGETVHKAHLHDRWRISRDGILVHADDLRLPKSMESLAQPAFLGGHRAFATIIHCAVMDEDGWEAQAQHLRAVLAPLRDDHCTAAVSAFAGKCVVRLMGRDTHALRPLMIAALGVINDGAALPTVWKT